MPTLPEVMTAIAEQIDRELKKVTDVTIHVEGRMFNVAELPSIDIAPSGVTGLEGGLAGFRDVYGGIPLSIRVRVSPADIYAGEELLLRLMDDEDPLSIVAALDSDPTVGGVLDTLGYGDGYNWTGYEPFADPNGGGDFLGSRLTIVVVKSQRDEELPAAPNEVAHYAYVGTGQGDPGSGGVNVHDWYDGGTWTFSKTDADSIARSGDLAPGEVFTVELPNGDEAELSVDSLPTQHTTWFLVTLTPLTVMPSGPPTPGDILTFHRGLS